MIVILGAFGIVRLARKIAKDKDFDSTDEESSNEGKIKSRKTSE